MSHESQLATKDKQLAIAQEPTVGALLQAVISQGVTGENVMALEKLCDLKIKLDDRDAEKEFNRAFVALQSEMQGVEATRIVPNKDGSTRYKFAPYEELMKSVRPLLEKHGFCITFNMAFSEGRIKSICTLLHTGGHSRSNEFAVRIGGGPPGATETQADGAAKTYAKRGALCDALNIVVEQDTDGDDGRGEGHPITQEQADYLRDKVKKTGADEQKFLKLAEAAGYAHIMEDKFKMLDATLDKFEAKRRQQQEEPRDKDGNVLF